MPNSDKGNGAIFGWAKSAALILITLAVAYRIAIASFNVELNFAELLSLVLALFSVGLATLFYFKATETSNTFYDNTYKFTKDIAELLSRIESGFGERLRHLDEGYASMRHQLETTPVMEVTEKKKEIKEEEKEVEKKTKERDQLITDLVAKARLEGNERQRVVEELKKKDEELLMARRELDFLRHRLGRAETESERIKSGPIPLRVTNYIRDPVLGRLGLTLEEASRPEIVIRRFKKIADELQSAFLHDLERYQLMDKDNMLTPAGYRLFRSIYEEK